QNRWQLFLDSGGDQARFIQRFDVDQIFRTEGIQLHLEQVGYGSNGNSEIQQRDQVFLFGMDLRVWKWLRRFRLLTGKQQMNGSTEILARTNESVAAHHLLRFVPKHFGSLLDTLQIIAMHQQINIASDE